MLAKIFFHPSIFSLLFIAFFLLNTSRIESTTLGMILLIAYLSVYGWQLGGVVAGQEKGLLRWWIGSLILLVCCLLILTIAYYLFAIPKDFFSVLILLTPPLVGILSHRYSGPSLFERFHIAWRDRKHTIPRTVFLASALILFLSVVLIQTLKRSAITDAVRSPWERMDASVFVLFGLILLLIFALMMRGRERALTLPLFSLVLFLFLSLAVFVFPLGYGFDSFIHRATEQYLSQFGTISPKPFYYIGQYVLVLFLHHGFEIPIQIADRWLVPILTALWLPIAWYSAAVHITRKKQLSMLTLIGLFLVPLSSFIVTTPQSLSNLFTFLLILASVPYLFESERPRLWLCGLIALAALAVHPIAGIPAVLYFILLCVEPSRAPKSAQALVKWIFFSLIAVASIILPASFLIHAAVSGQAIAFDFGALNPLTLLQGLPLNIFFDNQFDPLLDFAYLTGKNSLLVLVAVAVCAWWGYRRELSKRTHILLWMTLAILINYLILKSAVDFTFLINYERLNYANRLIPLGAFFLVPFFILGFAHAFTNLQSRPLILKATLLVLLAGNALGAFYLMYPRRDAYETGRAFNTSASDLAAVHLIENWTEGKPYLALANQSVSAAAISEIGFRYYGSLFFYPIPTGDILYQKFLAMNETPTREIANEALTLIPMHGDVFTLFFVVNEYWWDAARIIETAKTTADDWRAVGGVYVFRYDLK